MSILSVFELRTVPAGSGAGVSDFVDSMESVRSGAEGFDEGVPFDLSFKSFLDSTAGLGEGFVDTDGPGEVANGENSMSAGATMEGGSGQETKQNVYALVDAESLPSTVLLEPEALVPTASFHWVVEDARQTWISTAG